MTDHDIIAAADRAAATLDDMFGPTWSVNSPRDGEWQVYLWRNARWIRTGIGCRAKGCFDAAPKLAAIVERLGKKGVVAQLAECRAEDAREQVREASSWRAHRARQDREEAGT